MEVKFIRIRASTGLKVKFGNKTIQLGILDPSYKLQSDVNPRIQTK